FFSHSILPAGPRTFYPGRRPRRPPGRRHDKIRVCAGQMSMKRKFGFGFMVAVLASATALGSDLAILRNGFSIRHERREVIDSATRLYLSGEAGSYVDVPTTEIERFEKDLTPTAVTVSPRSQFEKDLTRTAVTVSPRSQNVNDFVNSASDRQRLDPDLV